MTMLFLQLALMLVVILAASELFTNALEHLGEKLGISEGVTGSLFAAIGTALPETTVPIIALMGGTASRAVNEEIGVGAILGAPLMLATLVHLPDGCRRAQDARPQGGRRARTQRLHPRSQLLPVRVS